MVVLYFAVAGQLAATRLRVGNRNYWTGTLKLHEALLDIALRYTSGETMSERIGLWLLIGYAGVTLVAAYGLWRLWPQTQRVVIYSTFWLAVPILAVLLLAFNVPKFNARYVMLAAPGTAAALGTGLAALGDRQPARSWLHSRVACMPCAGMGHAHVPVLRGPGSLWAAALCVVLLVAGGLWATGTGSSILPSIRITGGNSLPFSPWGGAGRANRAGERSRLAGVGILCARPAGGAAAGH